MVINRIIIYLKLTNSNRVLMMSVKTENWPFVSGNEEILLNFSFRER